MSHKHTRVYKHPSSSSQMKHRHCLVNVIMDINHEKHVVQKDIAIHYSINGYPIRDVVDELINIYNTKYAATIGQICIDQVWYIYICIFHVYDM